MIALYSIKPVYSNQIINGKKKYELRKRIPSKKLDYILIYSSSPVSKVIGYAEVKDVYRNTVSQVWEYTSDFAGISRQDYEEYFKGCQDAYAIELGDTKKFVRPFDLVEINEDYVAPQSFSYITNNEFHRLRRRKTEDVPWPE